MASTKLIQFVYVTSKISDIVFSIIPETKNQKTIIILFIVVIIHLVFGVVVVALE